jgi:MFS family permease
MLGFDAFSLLRNRSFLVLFIASVLISIPLAFYYNFTNLFLNEIGMENAAGKQTLGQQSEVLFMLLMPLLVRRMGIKWMVAVGMLAWAVRYVLFAFGDVSPALVWMLYAGIVLHGICYDFFFVAGQIYANREAPESLKNSVQGLMALGTYGVGMFIGSLVSGWLVSHYTAADGLKAWETIWLIPASMAAVVLVLFGRLHEQSSKCEVQYAIPEETHHLWTGATCFTGLWCRRYGQHGSQSQHHLHHHR